MRASDRTYVTNWSRARNAAIFDVFPSTLRTIHDRPNTIREALATNYFEYAERLYSLTFVLKHRDI